MSGCEIGEVGLSLIGNGVLNGKQNKMCIALVKYYVPKVQKQSR